MPRTRAAQILAMIASNGNMDAKQNKKALGERSGSGESAASLLEDIQTNGTSEKVTKVGPENKEQMETCAGTHMRPPPRYLHVAHSPLIWIMTALLVRARP